MSADIKSSAHVFFGDVGYHWAQIPPNMEMRSGFWRCTLFASSRLLSLHGNGVGKLPSYFLEKGVGAEIKDLSQRVLRYKQRDLKLEAGDRIALRWWEYY